MENFLKRKFGLLLFVVYFFCLPSCSKKMPEGNLPDGYIAMTFDDSSISNWYTCMPLLDSLDIKATFYISHYHTYNASQKKQLLAIKKHGHEIAYHTSNHLNLAKLVKESDGWAKVMKEVNSDLKLMQNDGYNILNFAYPYGQHTASLDSGLLKIFSSVRGVSNRSNYYSCLTSERGYKKVLFGCNIDMNTPLPESNQKQLIAIAKEKKTSLVLLAHQINNPAVKNQITTDRLRMIAASAQKNNLKFITVADIL